MTTILLVDDDPLRAVVRKSILEKRFANVLRAADAAEALCLVEEPKLSGELSLVVSGLNLPGIGGPAFVSELHSRLPAVPVLVLGGVGEAPADYAGQPVEFLPRPATADELLTAAGKLLGQTGR